MMIPSPIPVFRASRRPVLAMCLALILPGLLFGQSSRPDLQPKAWRSVGPYGGDARAFAVDPSNPQHLYLGTTSSWIYQSSNGGKSWSRLAKLGGGNDLVIDHISVDRKDAKTLVAAAWKVDAKGGGIYVSHDAGRSWTAAPDMAGQSVRALVQARSNPEVYVAGTLSGVYRSTDGAQHWSEISPAGSHELHEIESVAVDPFDTQTIYAGTWHLPWRTTDGGQHWSSIKKGLIDDSDIFSIIIDPKQPTVVYASACSGIYKSETAGQLFRKVQGIPSTARRTRVLKQDPEDLNVVYAGTTEGLYKTSDAGANWVRLTGPDVIVNDVYVDPADQQHVLLATSRSGVLASEDGGKTFLASNQGFSQRQVQTLLVDHTNPQTLYAGVLNDKLYGGVFVSRDGGNSWTQQSNGLDGRDVFALAQSSDGAVYAGTNDGLLKLVGSEWRPEGDVLSASTRTVVERVHGRRVRRSIATERKAGTIDGRVNAVDLAGDTWFAATANGIYRSMDHGNGWARLSVPPGDYGFVRSAGAGGQVLASTRTSLMYSSDVGAHWSPIPLPSSLGGVSALTLSPDGTLWVGGREGAFFSKDRGGDWQPVKNLPLPGIGGLNYDPTMHRVLISSPYSTMIFGVDAAGDRWKFWQTGWRVHQVLQSGDRLVAASLFDGVVTQPQPDVAAVSSSPVTAGH